MNHIDSSAGATPVESGAMPLQSYPVSPVFAAYRLPWPGAHGTVDPRSVGIGFDGEGGGTSDSSSGGTTGNAGAGAGTQGGTTGAAGDTSATDDDATKLGDAGKRALEAERASRKAAEARASAAEKERDELKSKTQTEQEKAVADAKKSGGDEVRTKVNGQIRRSEVKAALSAAGINTSVLDLATKADEFAALEVTDDGEVTGLQAAIDGFKKSRPDLFKPATTTGTADGGARSGDGKEPAKTLTDALERHYDPAKS